MSDKINYKFIFIGIIFAYFISQNVIAILKPYSFIYISLLQILFFLIPLLIIHFATISENPLKTFKIYYKINFKFKPYLLPCILWILSGVLFFEMGFEIVIKNILPFDLAMYYDNLNNYFFKDTLAIAQIQNFTINEFLFRLFVIAVVPSICEEFLFRGYLLQNILKKHNQNYAIFISAIIFAIIHINPISFIPIFILGLFLGKLFFATNSILTPVLLHFINNFSSFFFLNFSTKTEHSKTDIFWIGICFIAISIVIFISIFNVINKKNSVSIVEVNNKKLTVG